MCSYIYSFLCSATQTFHVESSFFSWVISCSISSSENPLVMTVSPLFLLYKSSWFYFFIIIILNIYLFIWLCQLLVAALGFFDFWCSLHDLSCTMQTLSWGMWDLVPSPGIKPGLPALGAWILSHWTTSEVPVGSTKSRESRARWMYVPSSLIRMSISAMSMLWGFFRECLIQGLLTLADIGNTSVPLSIFFVCCSWYTPWPLRFL